MIELTTVIESRGTVLNTSVTRINLPDYNELADIIESKKPLKVIENSACNADSGTCESEITTTRIINPDGSITKTMKTVTTIKKTTILTVLTDDDRILIKNHVIN
jgi:hypothetical protein